MEKGVAWRFRPLCTVVISAVRIAEATRRRRRSSRASFFLVSQEIASYGIKRSAGLAMRQRKGILILSCEKERR